MAYHGTTTPYPSRRVRLGGLFAAALFFVCGTGACVPKDNPLPPRASTAITSSESTTQDDHPETTTKKSDMDLNALAEQLRDLEHAALIPSEGQHFRLTYANEPANFKSVRVVRDAADWERRKNALQIDGADYDTEFFEQHALVLVRCITTSGSLDPHVALYQADEAHFVADITFPDDTDTFGHRKGNKVGTADMASWLFVLEVDLSDLGEREPLPSASESAEGDTAYR